MGAELVDALVELHRVDPGSCGLASLGKGRGYLERQLRRWSGQLELTVPYTRPLPALQRARSWLEARMPQSDDVTIVHGDYKLDNVMFRVGAPARLASIFDWEMCTLGDPLADVAWMTVCWREASDDPDDWFARISRVTEAPGFGTRAELMHRYAHATGRDLSALGWYQVLALYKLAILLEGSYARHLAGVTDDPFFVELETAVPALADRALTIAEA